MKTLMLLAMIICQVGTRPTPTPIVKPIVIPDYVDKATTVKMDEYLQRGAWYSELQNLIYWNKGIVSEMDAATAEMPLLRKEVSGQADMIKELTVRVEKLEGR